MNSMSNSEKSVFPDGSISGESTRSLHSASSELERSELERSQQEREPAFDVASSDAPRSNVELHDGHAPHTPSVRETTHSPNTDVAVPAETSSTADKSAKPTKNRVKGSFAGTTYVSLVVGIILLILLLVFILQNQDPANINLFSWQWEFPIGVGMLFAAILGSLITAFIGGWRMFELRRQVKRAGTKR